MKRITGGGLPARLWREVMTEAHQGWPPRPLPGIGTEAPLISEVRERVPVAAPVADRFTSFLERLTGGIRGAAPVDLHSTDPMR
jgi:penicillin-binding protein 1A